MREYANPTETDRKAAIVTGASRGIGKAIAEKFAGEGYDVALLSRHYNEVEAATEKLKTMGNGLYLPFECDVGDKDAVVETFSRIDDRLGSIGVLVNNAGVNSWRTLNAKNPENWLDVFEDNLSGWDDEIATNLTGVYICSYLAAGYMVRQGYGSIVNISSIKGKEPTSSPGYGASKAGVIKLTRDFAKALAPYGIKVNCVAPGFIDTGMTTKLSEDKKHAYKARIPMGRFGTVEEVAKAVAFLASDEACYITGATLDVNGGYLMD